MPITGILPPDFAHEPLKKSKYGVLGGAPTEEANVAIW
jgi:hypothetical protein